MDLKINEVFAELHEAIDGNEEKNIRKLILPDVPHYLSLGLSSGNIYFSVEISERLEPQLKAIPKIKGLNISARTFNDERPKYFSLTMAPVDKSFQDAFLVFASDVIASFINEPEDKLFGILVARLQHWQHFFTPQPIRFLSRERQLGLLGELYFLEEMLNTEVTPYEALSFWTGPAGKSKDFCIKNLVDFEVKAVLNDAEIVKISSEHQLDITAEKLYLAVYNFVNGSDCSENLNTAVHRLKIKLKDHDDAFMFFCSLLLASGYTEAHSEYYESLQIALKDMRIYTVETDFPRITDCNTSYGVFGVKYNLSLLACEPYLTAENVNDIIAKI